jgi:hypothetical protein
MCSFPGKHPLGIPSSPCMLTADTILYGLPIPAMDRVKVMGDKEYEDFIGEWLFGYMRSKYAQIYHLGGSGDLGRDFAAYVTEDGTIWDNYQCKHYKSPLSPADILKEIGKLVYHCFNGHYSWPRMYYFVAPMISPKAHDLLKDSMKLKNGLISRWPELNKHFSKSEAMYLSSSMRTFIHTLDFSIFSSIPGEDIINQHAQTVYYAPRFGGGLRPRPRTKPKVSHEIQEHEMVYIKKIFDAYSLDESILITCKSDLNKCPHLIDHFHHQRMNYYEAETLKQFSREVLPPGSEAFEDFKEEIYHGIIPAIDGKYTSCKDRLDHVLLAAGQTPIESNVLKGNIRISDKHGVCHHLANERDDIRWNRNGKISFIQ